VPDRLREAAGDVDSGDLGAAEAAEPGPGGEVAVSVDRRAGGSARSDRWAAPGVCWDNALAESFFATLKNELIYTRSWTTRNGCRLAVVEWIEGFYNRRRMHSSIGYLAPFEKERRHSHDERDERDAAQSTKTCPATRNRWRYRIDSREHEFTCPPNRGNSTRWQPGDVVKSEPFSLG